MADPQDPKAGDAAATEADRVKNLQAEMQRKIDNQQTLIEQSSRETKAQLDAILASLNKQAPAKAAPTKKLGDMLFDDPDAAINQIAEQVGNSVTQRVMGQVSSQTQMTQAAAQLESEYPEFADRTSEHFKRVESYYKSLPQNLQGTPQGLENAAYRAAAEYGLIPKSKRQVAASSDDFSMPSGGSARRQSAKEKSGEMKPEQLAFAQLLGAPLNDPKFKEVYKKAAARTEWNKYKGEED